MRQPTSLSFLSLLLVLPACATAPEPRTVAPAGQTFPDAVAMLCDVDRLAGITAEGEPLSVGVKRTAWIAEHVENPDGIELRTLLSVKGAEEQAKMLRERASSIGLTRCALADSMEKTGSGGISP